jgi:nitrogenase subunit NifH
LVAFFPRDEVFHESEINQRTVLEHNADHPVSDRFKALSKTVSDTPRLVCPTPF